ncbi:U-scoloptoxin(16)-Ssd1a-like [Lycorma delicatula]|uniref:U-scoloptoxin(16)-Ssd1a-like n=1 Tax=Lycorma delicatula TaxID=130591 RepID=UPI003F510A97
MFLRKIILMFCITFVTVKAAVFSGTQTAQNGSCTHNGNYIPVGEEWFSPDCAKFTCSPAGADNLVYLEGYTCGLVRIEHPPECQLVYDNTKKYPDCCTPEVKCPDGNKL